MTRSASAGDCSVGSVFATPGESVRDTGHLDSGGLRVELTARSGALDAAWGVLAERLAAPAFLHPGWAEAWEASFAPGRLRVLSAWDGDSLAGLLPLLSRGGVYRSPTNWHTPLFGPLAGDGAVRRALLRGLLKAGRTRADISFVDRDDATVADFQDVAASLGRPVVVRTIQRSPYVEVAGRSWGAFEGSLRPKVRKEARRLHRRLEDRGDLTVEFLKGVRNLDAVLQEGFRLEGSGWKDAQGSAILSDGSTRRFYGDVARWANARGELLLAFLRLDGRAIAFDLCLEAAGRTYVLKGGFDPAFRRFGPGMVLTYESLRRVFDSGGAQSYELLGDADPYKLSWTEKVRDLVRLQAFGRTIPGLASRLAWTHGRSAVRRIMTIRLSQQPRRGEGG